MNSCSNIHDTVIKKKCKYLLLIILTKGLGKGLIPFISRLHVGSYIRCTGSDTSIYLSKLF